MKREELIQCRLSKGKKQAEVARDLNISEVYLRKIKSGDRAPGRDTMIAFERYYQRPAHALFPDIYAPK